MSLCPFYDSSKPLSNAFIVFRLSENFARWENPRMFKKSVWLQNRSVIGNSSFVSSLVYIRGGDDSEKVFDCVILFFHTRSLTEITACVKL